ncbi:MAG: hypothetical protein GX898_07745 [Corynebacterium sp.]|nr:hypothetical protein [Corynebacterium sp.]
MTHVVLSPSTQILIRPGPAIQFGVDATRAGVLEMDSTELASRIVPVLLGLRDGGHGVEVLAKKLVAAGLRPLAATSLIEDLLAFGVLRETTPGEVLLWGRGTLLDATASLIAATGLVPRIALRGDKPRVFLTRPARHVVVLNRLAHPGDLARLLAHRVSTYLTAALIDNRGLIGPGRRSHRGPCMMCIDLHRTDVDPHWHALVTQQPNGPTHPDPITEAATAARLAALLHTDTWQAGEVEEINPYVGTSALGKISVHPGCPICFTALNPG